MNPDVKRKWVDALRSGQYVQGHNRLRVSGMAGRFPTAHCCLGVLCEIFQQETGLGEWVPGDLFRVEDHDSGGYPPGPVAAWAGLDDVNPKITINDTQRDRIRSAMGDPDDPDIDLNHPNDIRLGNLNDAGVGFDVIADLVEETL